MKHEFQEQSIQKMHPKSSAVAVELMRCAVEQHARACFASATQCMAACDRYSTQPTNAQLISVCIWHGHKKVKQCKNLPVAIVAVADVVADTDDG